MGLHYMEGMKGEGVVLYIDIFLSFMGAIIRMAYVQKGMIRSPNWISRYWWGFCYIRKNQGRGKYYQPSQWPKAITLSKILIILDITKTESSNCFIIHCFEQNNDKHTIALGTDFISFS